MFFQPASFIAFGRGEWSLATVAIGPCAEPAHSASRSPPAAGRSGGPILASGPHCCISFSVSSRYCGHVSV